MDRRIKFRHLDAFSAIARAGSFKRAAAALNLSQPAISKALKELEEILGATLLVRDRAGVRLTQKGTVFLQFAEQSTAALRHGLHSVRSSGAARQILRIGALPSVASGLLPEAVASFAGRNPDTLLEITEGAHADLTAGLRGGHLDMVVGRLGRPQTMQGLVFRQLYSEDVVVVAAPDSAAVPLRRFEDIDRFTVLYPPPDSAIRPLVARMLIARGVPLFRHRIETASAAFGRALTRANPDTVWVISRGVVEDDLAEGRLVRLEIDTGPTTGAVGIMSIADEVPSAAFRAFSKALQGAARKRRAA